MVSANSGIELLRVQSQDGAESDLRLHRASAGATDVLLFLPAMGVTAKKYDAFAHNLSHQGINAAVFEWRGHGSSTVRASRSQDWGYCQILSDDLVSACQIVAHALPDSRLSLGGHSLGGQIASLYTSLNRQSIKSLLLVASCSVHYRGWHWPQSWFLLGFSQLFWLVSTLLGYFPGHRLRFAGVESRSVMADWAYTARSGEYRLRSSNFDFEAALAEVKIPLTAVNFTNDRFAPMRATNNLLAKMPRSVAQRRLFGQDELKGRRADHFAWLRDSQCVAKYLSDQIAQQDSLT